MRLMRAPVLATLAFFLSTSRAVSTISAAGFVSSDKSLTFALNIPQVDDNNDLYFTLSGPSSSSWIAVGMGSYQMKNSMIFMIYADSTGTKVTLSPRIGHGNYEPAHTKEFVVELMPGSGIANNIMTANVRCQDCQVWSGGKIDSSNTKAPFIFASGPDGKFRSDSVDASVRRHAVYGSFTLNMTNAMGSKAVPNADYADRGNTVQLSLKGDRDLGPPFHAFFMLFTFVGLMPVGIMILRILNKPKWHGVNQAISVILALVGVGLGFYIGKFYQRTWSFTSAHQIFGIIIIGMLIGQFVLGFLHHRMWKQTGTPTIFSKIHIWLGRIVIPGGIANGFLGFPLALNTRYNWALLILVLLVLLVAGPFAFWRYKRNKQTRRTNRGVDGMEDAGYQAQPWNTSAQSSYTNLSHMQNYPMQNQTPQQDRRFG